MEHVKDVNAKDASIDTLRLFRNCVIFAVVFGLAAHAYCYFNLTLSHDALFSLYRQDAEGQIQLGRFMHVPYQFVRGGITAPALIGFLSLVFLSLSSYLTVRLLDIRNTLLVALTCGILATNVTLTFTNATYLHESDMYLLALLLACGAVWCCRAWRHGWLVGAVLAMMSLGFYQAYFSVSLMLFIMIAIGRVLDGAPPKQVLREIVPMLGTVVLGFALYLALVFATTSLTGVGLSSGYNGLEGAGDFSTVSIPALIAKTWLYPVRYLVMPEGLYPLAMGVANVVLSLATIVTLFWLARRERVSAGGIAVMVLLLLLMPFAANYVYLISKGVVHSLMVYAFFYWYVFAIQVQQRAAQAGEGQGAGESASEFEDAGECASEVEGDAESKVEGDAENKGANEGRGLCQSAAARILPATRGLPAVTATIVALVCAMSVLFGIVFANQAYFKKQLQFEATEFAVDRVLDRVEQLDGYVPGKTPVYLAGSFHDSPLFAERAGFQDIQGTGFYWQSAITYDESSYFSFILGYPINLLSNEQAAAQLDMATVQGMGVFPAADSTAMVDGVAVVRLSEDLSD